MIKILNEITHQPYLSDMNFHLSNTEIYTAVTCHDLAKWRKTWLFSQSDAVKPVYSDTWVIHFPVLSDIDFYTLSDHFLCVLHCVLRHPIYSDTKFQCMWDKTAFTVDIFPFMLDWLIIYFFSPYWQYFRHKMAALPLCNPCTSIIIIICLHVFYFMTRSRIFHWN